MKRIVVAMSGGVDSSVAAFLLKKQGYDVTGVTMRLSSAEIAGARQVARRLGIPHRVLDLRREFERDVIAYFCSEYRKGRTPNPCAVCNRRIKFGRLLGEAKALGADCLATGHYARIGRDARTGRYFIGEAADKLKDQSYFLFGLGQSQLKRIVFPLGGLTKENVKAIAESAGLGRLRAKPESQDICFITRGDYRDFIRKRIKGIKPGRIVDTDGKFLGVHKGAAFYTIGQRQGLGIAAKRPLYVVKIDARKNEITAGGAQDVLSRELTASRVNWMGSAGLSRPFRAQAKIRYNRGKAGCRIIPVSRSSVKAVFDKPQYAVTPGQAFVFYGRDRILGGGWIE